MKIEKSFELKNCNNCGIEYKHYATKKFPLCIECTKQHRKLESRLKPEEYKKNLPTRFDWQNAFAVFTESIPCNVQMQISKNLEFKKMYESFVNNKSSGLQMQKYLDSQIGILDKTQKYARKFIEIVSSNFKMQLKCPTF